MNDKGRYRESLFCLRWLAGWIILYCLLFPAWCPAEIQAGNSVGDGEHPSLQTDFKYTQEQLLKETLGVAHDELIMLIISLVVVIQIIVSFKFLQWLPHRIYIFCSFGFFLFSSICTVAEGFFLAETLNVLEHLSFMVSAVLLTVWCWYVFGAKKQESN